MQILKHELIGLEAKVINSPNKNLIGLRGKITDETRNTLSIQKGNETKTIIKEQAEFFIKKENNWVPVWGKLLVGRPEDRIKKLPDNR